MKKAILFNFVIDKENKSIKVERSFHAPIDLVWAAWTEADILDQWWAPKPYKSVTKSMNFKEGGRWHYYMLGPEGDKQWCLFDFQRIKPLQSFSGVDAFCDENEVINDTKPKVKWENDFVDKQSETIVNLQLQFESFEDLEALMAMGFKEGFTAGLQNLDEYLSTQASSK